jgi:tetratricopeptide (TPR) repeat protein
LKAHGVDYLGRDHQRDDATLELPVRSGTIFSDANSLAPKDYWDRKSLRETQPALRFGNLLIYKGNFSLPGQGAEFLYWRGVEKLYAARPDEAGAEQAFRKSVQIDPTPYFIYIELGNLCLKRGDREEALRDYSTALQRAPNDFLIRPQIVQQVRSVETGQIKNLSPLRNPFME